MSPKSYYTIFGEKMSEEEVSSLETRIQRARDFESSLSPEQKAKLVDDTDIKNMMRGIIE